MNNKLIAGIAAMAISASLMSTVAFAADPTFAVNGDTATMSFKVGENNADVTVSSEAQITMMAYLVDETVAKPEDIPAYSNQTVVALNQVDGATGFGDVLIAASKLVAGKKIAVVLGGSDGTTEKCLVAQEVVGGETKITVTFMNGGTAAYKVVEIDKDTALDLSTVTAPTFTADPQYKGYVMVDKATAKFTFVGWVDANDADFADGTVVSEDITLTAKYNTGIVYGDSNADGSANSTDISGVVNFFKNGATSRNHYTNKPIYPGIVGPKGNLVVAGDSNGDGSANSTDISGIVNWFKNTTVSRNHYTGKPIYFINK